MLRWRIESTRTNEMFMPTAALTGTQSPTLAVYSALQRAFDHFNRTLFEDQLEPCLLTLRSSSRHHGYHHKGRFVDAGGRRLDEIGLNPGYFALSPAEELLSTLVHEMVHHWQEQLGRPSAGNAHNRQWAERMEAIGLIPTQTGLPGGPKTGNRMTHYIAPDGLFLVSCRELIDSGWALRWFDRHLPAPPDSGRQRLLALAEAGIVVPMGEAPVVALEATDAEGDAVLPPPPRRGSDRVRSHCEQCGAKAWAGRETLLVCGRCGTAMVWVDA